MLITCTSAVRLNKARNYSTLLSATIYGNRGKGILATLSPRMLGSHMYDESMTWDLAREIVSGYLDKVHSLYPPIVLLNYDFSSTYDLWGGRRDSFVFKYKEYGKKKVHEVHWLNGSTNLLCVCCPGSAVLR